jgi:ketosteroid isomerase-like protein
MTQDEQRDAERQVRAAEVAHVKAIMEQDEATLLALWAPEMVVNAPNNQVGDRAGTLRLMRAGIVRYHAYEQSIECVKAFGDTVIVMGQEMVNPVSGPDEGKTVQRRFLDIWQKAEGQWRQVARQATVIPG